MASITITRRTRSIAYGVTTSTERYQDARGEVRNRVREVTSPDVAGLCVSQVRDAVSARDRAVGITGYDAACPARRRSMWIAGRRVLDVRDAMDAIEMLRAGVVDSAQIEVVS